MRRRSRAPPWERLYLSAACGHNLPMFEGAIVASRPVRTERFTAIHVFQIEAGRKTGQNALYRISDISNG